MYVYAYVYVVVKSHYGHSVTRQTMKTAHGAVHGGRMTAELERLSVAWTHMSEVWSVPHTEAEYRGISTLLDLVLDEVGEDDSHPLASLMETLGALVNAYEREHVRESCRSSLAGGGRSTSAK